MGPSLRALVCQTTILVGFLLWFLAIKVSVVEHVDTDKVGHFIVHLFALA